MRSAGTKILAQQPGHLPFTPPSSCYISANDILHSRFHLGIAVFVRVFRFYFESVQALANARWHRRKWWLSAIVTAATPAAPAILQSNEDIPIESVLAATPPECLPLDASPAYGVTFTDEEPALRALLLDKRIVAARGRFITSAIVGVTATFLSQCCEKRVCPRQHCYQPGQRMPASDEDEVVAVVPV